MDVYDLEALLPHRPPILMVDRVVDIEPGIGGTGVRRFEPGDACFEGHFPGRPILPGVLIIEAFAQTLMVVMLVERYAQATDPLPRHPLGYLTRVKEMSFQSPIGPGQEIRFAIRIDKQLGQFTIASGRATRDEVLCAKGSLAVALDQTELSAPAGTSESATPERKGNDQRD